MSSLTSESDDRLGRAANLRTNRYFSPRARSRLRRIVTFVIPFSALMLMMFAGLAMRAFIALTQGMH